MDVLKILPQYQVRIYREANKLMLQAPLLALVPPKSLGGALAMFSHFLFFKICKMKIF
jgi:hypothetical protein